MIQVCVASVNSARNVRTLKLWHTVEQWTIAKGEYIQLNTK